MSKSARQQRFDRILDSILVPFRNTFGVDAPLGCKLRWAYEDGRLNREEFEFMLAEGGERDPGIVAEWLPSILQARRFALQAEKMEQQPTLF